jgi:hypothetical protein
MLRISFVECRVEFGNMRMHVSQVPSIGCGLACFQHSDTTSGSANWSKVHTHIRQIVGASRSINVVTRPNSPVELPAGAKQVITSSRHRITI